RLAKIIKAEITAHDCDVIQRAVGHQIGQKTDRIGQRLLWRFEPDDSQCHRHEIASMRKRLHCAASPRRTAFKFGSLAGSVAFTASANSRRRSWGRSASAVSPWYEIALSDSKGLNSAP